MILPIYAFGNPVLKKKAQPIEPGYPDLSKLIEDMYETMYESNGIGLAAPQIGQSIRLFITDGSPVESIKGDDFKKVFINPEILDENGDKWTFEEGCLSIPNIRENVVRHPVVRIRYQDENFIEKEEEFDGMRARIIQHEYDHLEGILFTDRISPLKRQLLAGRLNNISKGKTKADYKLKFPIKK